MKDNYTKIINRLKTLEEKNLLSENLESLIKQIEESTETDGNIKLQIVRTGTFFNIEASDLLKKIENKRKNIDDQIDLLVNSITING